MWIEIPSIAASIVAASSGERVAKLVDHRVDFNGGKLDIIDVNNCKLRGYKVLCICRHNLNRIRIPSKVSERI